MHALAKAALKRQGDPLFTAEMADAAEKLYLNEQCIPVYRGEFWTAMQRQAASIHEVSYRACFKPQLPAYFISRLTAPGDVVYDPFSGRGTTAVEAALLGRRVIANDINPLSAILTRPRLDLPDLDAISARLAEIDLSAGADIALDLSMFFHAGTLREIAALRAYLQRRHSQGAEDAVDRWIRMVATNRLTGHSKGFFSVYTLPPIQATSAQRQIKINAKRAQTPEYRDTRALILKKSRQLQRGLIAEQSPNLHAAGKRAQFLTDKADATRAIAAGSVQLTVTSPPFLDIVQYSNDNWLRCWFNDLDADAIQLAMARASRAKRSSSTSSASRRPRTSGESATTRPAPTATASWCSEKPERALTGRAWRSPSCAPRPMKSSTVPCECCAWRSPC